MRYFIVPLLLLAVLAASLLGPLYDPRRTKSQRERSVSIRLTLFSWVLGAVFVAGLLFAPNKPRVLLMAPIVVVIIGVARLWKNSRARAQQGGKADLEGMKRVRPTGKPR